MSITNRTVTNTVTGETITFLETSAETGGVRVVAEITLTPGGSVIPHSHRVSETFECLDGSFITHLAGKETEFIPGQRMIAEPHEMHGFRNDTAQPANEHAARLWESLGFTTLRVCTSTKSAASDITTSGRHVHNSPAEAVKEGRLIVAKALA